MDETLPLLSCLCVTENRPAFMPWLLWNYERQTWPHRELVIVDSSAEPYRSERKDVRVVRAPQGSGVATKRNLALRHARGEAVTWFDDDDWQHPEKLALLWDALAERGALYAGGRCGWFLHLDEGRCARYGGSGNHLIFNSAGFRTAAVRALPFPDNVRRASDTRWMQALRRAHPQGARPLEREDLFFWLCHDVNLSNRASQRRFPRSYEALRDLVGEAAWGDTDEALDALRRRREEVAAVPRPSEVRSEAVPKERPPSFSHSEEVGEDTPLVGLMVKATVMDAPFLDVMVRHMVSQARYSFAERVIVVDERPTFSGKYRARSRSTRVELDRVLQRLLDDDVIDGVQEVEYRQERVREVMERYFPGQGARVPTHATSGGPIYPTLFGLEALSTDFVLQMDADVFFHSGSRSWVASALEHLCRDPSLWLMMTHAGPPVGPPGDSLGTRNRRLATWDTERLLWLFRTATTRYFLCDRRRLRGMLRPLWQGGGCLPLEQCLGDALQRRGAWRGMLGDLESWHVHAWHHGPPFPEWSAALAASIEAGSVPACQLGEYDLRLDRARDQRDWKALIQPESGTGVVGLSSLVRTPDAREEPAQVKESIPLAVIIPVRDRAGPRLRNALQSLLWQTAGRPRQIIVVSHGSRPEQERALAALCDEAGATLITTGTPTMPWNKSLALNVGIRAVPPETPYLMTMDVDMILAPNFCTVVLDRLQRLPPALVLCRSADLPHHLPLPQGDHLLTHFERLRQQAQLRPRTGCGGIQAASRDFFFAVRGYDEDLLWWGAMDGDMVNRARLMGLETEWIEGHTSMLHQWHPRKHHNLQNRRQIEQARTSWQHNHALVRQRVAQPRRNVSGWGGVVDMPTEVALQVERG